jgi:hypothetical protein
MPIAKKGPVIDVPAMIDRLKLPTLFIIYFLASIQRNQTCKPLVRTRAGDLVIGLMSYYFNQRIFAKRI